MIFSTKCKIIFWAKHCNQCGENVIPRVAKNNCKHCGVCPFKNMPLYEMNLYEITDYPDIACPQCGDKTFYGLFPAITEDDGTKIPARMLCKWCGYYYSREYGLRQCEPDVETHVWQFRKGKGKCLTPKEMAELPSQSRYKAISLK